MNWEYIIAAVVVFILIPLVAVGFKLLKLKCKDVQLLAFMQTVETLVSAAEEMYIKGELDNRLAYVHTHLQRWLDSAKIKLDVGLVSAYIKDAVSRLPKTTPRLKNGEN